MSVRDVLPPSLAPRGLSREEAAAYAGCKTISSFKERVRKGLLPKSIPGTHTWDRKAIDAALDRASGLAAKSGLSPLEEWRAKRARTHEGRSHSQEAVGQR
jgi:hypothetical protein